MPFTVTPIDAVKATVAPADTNPKAEDVLADYVVPVSIDHAGRYPSKRPGDVWFEELNWRHFRLELVGKPRDKRPGYDPNWGSTVLCDCHVVEVRQ